MSVPSPRFNRGEYLPVDYTPEEAVSAGDVVVQGDLIAVATVAIAANKLGALQVVGPMGVWTFPKSTGSGTALTVGQVVYWDADNSVVTTTASTHKVLGKVFEAAATTASTVLITGVQQATP